VTSGAIHVSQVPESGGPLPLPYELRPCFRPPSLFPSPGLAYGRGKLFIADTYNNKIKVCDPNTLAVKTFAGDGKPGSGDESPRFYQPGGLSVAGDSLYVADTNNHKIRVIDIQSGAVRTLEIAGLNAPRSEKVSAIQAD